jgi:hypothetical protein
MAEDRVVDRQYVPGRVLARDYVYPDYLDEEALTALATAKGVSLDPVALGMTRSATSGVSSTDELGGALRTPVSEVSARASTTVSDETSIGRSIAIQRRHTMRWVVDELTAMLRSEGALREDLAVVPADCENEVRVGQALLTARSKWGLAEIDREMTAERRERAAAQEMTEAADDAGVETDAPAREEARMDYDPQNPTPQQLVLAIDTLMFAAGDVIREAMVRNVEEMLAEQTRTMFALVTMFWGFWAEGPDVPHLWNGGVVMRDEPDVVTLGPAPPVLHVPLDVEKLNPLARARYSHRGPYQPLQVFAKIEEVDPFGRGIILTPIVLLSA